MGAAAALGAVTVAAIKLSTKVSLTHDTMIADMII